MCRYIKSCDLDDHLTVLFLLFTRQPMTERNTAVFLCVVVYVLHHSVEEKKIYLKHRFHKVYESGTFIQH